MEAQACSWGQGFSLIDWPLEWICAKNSLAETTELLLKIKSLSGLSPKGLFYIIIIIIIVIITIILKKYQRLAHSVAVSPSVTHAPVLQSHLKASLVTQLATSRFELSDDYWRKDPSTSASENQVKALFYSQVALHLAHSTIAF